MLFLYPGREWKRENNTSERYIGINGLSGRSLAPELNYLSPEHLSRMMLGTLINAGTIVLASITGMILGARLREELRNALISVLGLAVLLIGLSMALKTLKKVHFTLRTNLNAQSLRMALYPQHCFSVLVQWQSLDRFRKD